MDKDKSNKVSDESSSDEEVELKFYKKLDKHKDKTREEIKDFKKEVGQKFELIRSEYVELKEENKELRKQNAQLKQSQIEHQLECAKEHRVLHEKNNLQDLMHLELYKHINNVDGKLETFIKFSNEQFELIKGKIEDRAAVLAKTIKPEDILPEIDPDKLKLLEDLLAGNDEALATLNETYAKTFTGLVEAGVHGAMSMFKGYNKEVHKMDADTSKSIKEAFMNTFVRNMFQIHGQHWATVAGEVILKAGILGGKYAYERYKYNVAQKHLKEYWNDERKKYIKEILPLLKESSEEYFLKIEKEFMHKYNWNYNMDNVEVTQVKQGDDKFNRKFHDMTI